MKSAPDEPKVRHSKNGNLWEDILKEDEPSQIKKIIIGISTWVAVATFGILTLAGLLWVAHTLTDASNDTRTLRTWLVYGILAITVVNLAVVFAKKRKKTLFFRYAEKPLKIGVVINTTIFIAVLAGHTISSIQSFSSSTAICQPLKNQINTIQQATVPIATNTSTGTAFAVDDGHTLLTAYHVIKEADKVYANYADGEVGIKVIDTAPELDLALLKISEPQSAHLTLSHTYNVADEIYSNGFPGNTFRAGQASLSRGIVSRYLSNEDLRMNYENIPGGLTMIQTDTAINPGNSGGALVSECGVIGIVVSISSSNSNLQQYGIRSEEGIGFAVTSETAAKRFNLSIR